MESMGPETERHLRALEAAYERERQQRDLLEKKYARLKRRYVRLERTHARMLLESHGEQPEPETQSREEEEEKEDGEEGWRRHRDRLRLLRSSPRHRRHLDFLLPGADSERHTPLSTPPRHEHHPSPYPTHSTTSRSSPLPTPSATLRSGGAPTHTHTRPRPRLRLQQSPERTAARAYGYELDQQLESREYAPGRYEWTSDRSPAPSVPSPPVSTALLSPSPSPAPRLNTQSDDEASVALARYLQQQENIAAYEEYEARLRETAEREYDQRLLLSSASAMSDVMGGQRQVDPDNMTYEELLQLGEEVGDVKKERWRQVAVHVLSRLPTHRWTRDHGEDIAYVFFYSSSLRLRLTAVVSTNERVRDGRLRTCSCIICQYNFVPNDRALTLPCAHVFHEGT
ncbi:hypothetical protein BBJ28_00024892 [Nothophytophthora sp. Chile5]|nr:hypothetical protein BBJ28_00024892 [Nothophytophthora sp. Chile5]